MASLVHSVSQLWTIETLLEVSTEIVGVELSVVLVLVIADSVAGADDSVTLFFGPLSQPVSMNGTARTVRALKNFFMKNIPFLRVNQNDLSLIIIKMFLSSFIVHDLKININCSLFNQEKRPCGLISL